MEFMNAVQRFKEQSGKAFPSYGEVLTIAVKLGYRQFIEEPGPTSQDLDDTEPFSDPPQSKCKTGSPRNPSPSPFRRQ